MATTSKISSKIQNLLLYYVRRNPLFSSSQRSSTRLPLRYLPTFRNPNFRSSFSPCFGLCGSISSKPSSSFASSFISSSRYLSTKFAETPERNVKYEINEDVEGTDVWEEEDTETETEPEIGDGGDGGGVVLQNCPWGERALSIAREVLLQFGDDMELFAFKTIPQGYICVRLDRLSKEYGCPSFDDLESYSRQYKKRLDEVGADGEIPNDLALEVSSPGAERLLRIPDDLERFKDMPMTVSYVEGDDSRSPEKNGVFFLDSIETETGNCIWRLADVKENRDPLAKGRPLSRKRRDWRLTLAYAMVKRVTLYLRW